MIKEGGYQNVIKMVSFVFAFLLVYTSYSQEYFQSNTILKEEVSYNSLSEEGVSRKLFSLLGSENNIDVRKISLNIKARLLIRISRDTDQKVTAKLSMTRVSLDGTITLRDFNVDSLLWPSGFAANLTIYNGILKRDTIRIPISASAYGKLETVDLSDYLSSNIEDVSAEISDFQFYYNENNFQQLQNLSSTIDYYYSYGKVLVDLIKKHSYHSVSNTQSKEKIFSGKIEIDRVYNLLNNHYFTDKLNLKDNDPIDLLKLTKKLYRLSNRASTLFNQQISANPQSSLNTHKNIETDGLKPLDFCRYYCDISKNYLYHGRLLQPSDASGFNEVASIDITKSAKQNLKLVIEFYNKNASINSEEIYQCIFNGFTSMAEDVISDDNYTDALLLLNNSLTINNWFGATKTQTYKLAVITALDGVASSYSRVGNVALNAHNLEFASLYFNRADAVFELNRKLIIDGNFPDSAFSDYIGLQYEIALKYIDARKFNAALSRLASVKDICSKLDNSTACTLVDSAACIAHSGNLKHKFNVLEEMIINNQYHDAYKQLLIVALYITDCHCSFEEENVILSKLSDSLFNKSIERSKILINAQKSEPALKLLLKARSIQNIAPKDSVELERLIQFAAEPVIIELIDEAKYHVWAYRMDGADSLSQKAEELNTMYFSRQNIRINLALEELSEQIRLRSCISYKNNYSDAITKAHIVIKGKQFNRLNQLLNEADWFITTYPECNIGQGEALELRKQYKEILNYYQQYNDLNEKLADSSYMEVIENYISLMDFYNSNKIYHYDISLPNTITFVINQKSLILTREAAMYYLEDEDYDTTFRYVKVFKEQGGTSKEIKHITTEIAINLAIRDNELNLPVNETLHEYTSGDNWYLYFKVTYLKSRIFNSDK